MRIRFRALTLRFSGLHRDDCGGGDIDDGGDVDVGDGCSGVDSSGGVIGDAHGDCCVRIGDDGDGGGANDDDDDGVGSDDGVC